MGTLDNTFTEVMSNQVTQRCVEMAVEQILGTKGIKLNDSTLAQVARSVIDNASDSPGTIKSSLIDGLTCDVEIPEEVFFECLDKVDSCIPEVIEAAVNAAVPNILSEMDCQAKTVSDLLKSDLVDFHNGIDLTWGTALDALGLLLNFNQEARGSFEAEYKEWPPEKQREFANKADALYRIQIRACRTAGEILCLLRGGFSDGASARWRALHELSVVAMYLAEHPDSVSNLHLVIRQSSA